MDKARELTEELSFKSVSKGGRSGLAYIADKQMTHNNTHRYKAHYNPEVDQIVIEV